MRGQSNEQQMGYEVDLAQRACFRGLGRLCLMKLSAHEGAAVIGQERRGGRSLSRGLGKHTGWTISHHSD